MHWQDFIITAGQIFFSIALLPMLFSKEKPVLFTSLITGAVLMVYAVTYISLQLWFGAITTTITGIVWLILGYQKLARSK